MKTIRITVTAVLILLNGLGAMAQTPDWLWVNREGGTSQDFGYDVAMDPNGNVVVVGAVQRYNSWGATADFSGTVVPVNGRDVFVAKYAQDGSLLWVRTAGYPEKAAEGKSVSVDASGNVYITGWFQDTISFSGFLLTGQGGQEVFVAKYDLSGNLLWTSGGGGLNDERAVDIAIDANGYCYVTGIFFSDTVHFGQITAVHTSAPVPWWQTGSNAFIVKYDWNGNALWLKQGGGSSTYSATCAGSSVTIDAFGYPIVAGTFAGDTVRFDNIALSNAAGFNSGPAFVVRYDPDGNIQWAKRTIVAAGNTSNLNAVASCADGSTVLLLNLYGDSARFDDVMIERTGYSDNVSTVKLSNEGVPLWAQVLGGATPNADQRGHNVTCDASGAAYITGYAYETDFHGTVMPTFGSGPFVARYAADGAFSWVLAADVLGTGRGIVTANGNEIYLTGDVSYEGSFGSIPSPQIGEYDVFLAKVGPGVVTDLSMVDRSPFVYSPNPTDGPLMLRFDTDALRTATLMDATGREVLNTALTGTAPTMSLDGLGSGVYVLRIAEGSTMLHARIVKQ